MNQPTETGAPVLKAIARSSDLHGYSGALAGFVRRTIPAESFTGIISGLVLQDLVEIEKCRTGWGSGKDSSDGDYLHLTEDGWKWYDAQ